MQFLVVLRFCCLLLAVRSVCLEVDLSVFYIAVLSFYLFCDGIIRMFLFRRVFLGIWILLLLIYFPNHIYLFPKCFNTQRWFSIAMFKIFHAAHATIYSWIYSSINTQHQGIHKYKTKTTPIYYVLIEKFLSSSNSLWSFFFLNLWRVDQCS